MLDPSDVGLAGVSVSVSSGGSTLATTATINDEVNHLIGFYSFSIPTESIADLSHVEVSIDESTLPSGLALNVVECDSSACVSAGNPTILDGNQELDIREKLNFLYCEIPQEEGLCWMTGGGVKFDPVSASWNAESRSHGPKDTVGGVVYPSCSSFPSNGGQWNHVSHKSKLHLIGTDITVIRCGNVPGIEPGTESPVCSVNFIEFEGVGRLQGIAGNKINIPARFFGRVEDRNEPGNEQSADSGEDIDRYFLRVEDEDGNLRLLVDADGVDDGQVDPLTITGGNFQIHCTSCDDGGGGGAGLQLLQTAYFLRGDSNTDGRVDISDAMFSLAHLFRGGPAPVCEDAADTNDDGSFNVADPIQSLVTAFSGGSPIPAPHSSAGLDPTADFLGCDIFR